MLRWSGLMPIAEQLPQGEQESFTENVHQI
jgi:hypothetical protein